MDEDLLNRNELSEKIIHVSGMYQNWFLDYASYVILERAVPHIYDGLKPVQRRILHSLKEMHDGRYHKVANVIGHTMKYHPHGDASIGDAMVQIGQKDLILDMQGNWGNIATGDSAKPQNEDLLLLVSPMLFHHQLLFSVLILLLLQQ